MLLNQMSKSKKGAQQVASSANGAVPTENEVLLAIRKSQSARYAHAHNCTLQQAGQAVDAANRIATATVIQRLAPPPPSSSRSSNYRGNQNDSSERKANRWATSAQQKRRRLAPLPPEEDVVADEDYADLLNASTDLTMCTSPLGLRTVLPCA